MKKRCCKCKIEKPRSKFYMYKTGWFHYVCRECKNTEKREHYRINKAKVNAVNAAWARKNRKRVREIQKRCKVKRAREIPWILRLDGARQRCNNPNVRKYHLYGGKGVKFLLTKEEIKKLWFIYGANKMKKPSLHRINSALDYRFDNCMFLEQVEHGKITALDQKRKREKNHA